MREALVVQSSYEEEVNPWLRCNTVVVGAENVVVWETNWLSRCVVSSSEGFNFMDLRTGSNVFFFRITIDVWR